METESQLMITLPFEVIEQIVVHLNNIDLMECLCVSQSWNLIFRPLRYQAVQLTEKHRIDKFFITLKDSSEQQRSSKRPKTRSTAAALKLPHIYNLGYYVRHLLVRDGIMTIKSMDKLASHCTQVRSIIFQWSSSSDKYINHQPNTRKFMSPVPFFQHFHSTNLRSLHLEVISEDLKTINLVIDLKTTILPVLQQLPNIEELKLSYLGLILHIDNIEEIHARCNKLKTLEIRHAFLCDHDLFNLIDEQGETNSYSDVEDTYKNRLDTIVPATNVRSLILPGYVWCLGEGIWLAYIFKKYPDLQTLNISCGERFNKAQHYYMARPSKVIAWRNHFPSLNRITMGRFSGKPSLDCPQLMKGIKEVILKDDTTANFEQWASDTIVAMDIELLQLCFIPKHIYAIKHFQHLRSLYLGIKNYQENCYQQLPIDIVLSSCSALEYMKIINTVISFSNNENGTMETRDEGIPVKIKSPLTKLHLYNVTLENSNIMTFIGDQCPRLTSMELLFCTWLMDYEDQANSNEYQVIRINMPNQRFTSLTLFYLRIASMLAPFSRATLDTDIFNEHDNQQPRKIVVRPEGHNDYLLIKLLSQENVYHSSNKLYMTDMSSIKQKQNMNDMMEWLEGDDVNSSKSRNDLKVFNDRIDNYDEKLKHWSTVLCCNHVNHFFFGEVQVDLTDNDYCRNYRLNQHLMSDLSSLEGRQVVL